MIRAGSCTWFALQCWSLTLVLFACGARGAERSSSTVVGVSNAMQGRMPDAYEPYELRADQSGGAPAAAPAVAELRSAEGQRYAAADPASAKQELSASDVGHARGPLLIYTASFQLSVFEVEKSQREAKALADGLGGFVAQQSQTAITLRIPAPRFEEAVTAIERMGKVLSRQVQALDVSEQYRDLALRLKTLEAMRTRLEELLARAANVKEALEVEQQLERVLGEIERLKGQLRALDDRIAYSTLTLAFTPTPQPALDQGAVFRLPFPWLEELGIHSLLEVTR